MATRCLTLPVTVAVAQAELFGRTLVAPAAESGLQLLFEDRLDEAAHPLAHLILERVVRAPVDR